jgi:hypothetical protein
MIDKRVSTLFASSALALLFSCDDDRPRPSTTRSTVLPDSSASDSPDKDAAPPSMEPVLPPMPPSSCGGLVGPNLCDPVTGWPCAVDQGETCEFSNAAGFFGCSAAGPGGFCDACDAKENGCGVGFTCNRIWCERYCCADSDCGSGTCSLNAYGQPNIAAIGYCGAEGIEQCFPRYMEPSDPSEPIPTTDAGPP